MSDNLKATARETRDDQRSFRWSLVAIGLVGTLIAVAIGNWWPAMGLGVETACLAIWALLF